MAKGKLARVTPTADARLMHKGGTGVRLVAEIYGADGAKVDAINVEDGAAFTRTLTEGLELRVRLASAADAA